jgi:hypothetical protein
MTREPEQVVGSRRSKSRDNATQPATALGAMDRHAATYLRLHRMRRTHHQRPAADRHRLTSTPDINLPVTMATTVDLDGHGHVQ